jgi:sialic acid synthase SpsE
MTTMRDYFGLEIGYSDHTKGWTVACAAVALGARVIEKHFTLDRNFPGPDHKASLEPSELRQMVESIRTIEQSLGNGEKVPHDAELDNRPVARKSLVAACAISKGELFSPENLLSKRPGDGRSPMSYWRLLGVAATRNYRPDEPID